MKTNYREELTNRLRYLNNQIAPLQARLDEDFVYQLPWVGEELWQKSFEARYISEVLKAMEGLEESTSSDNVCPVRQVIFHNCKQLKAITTRSYNVRVNSTGSLHREISTWQFQVQLELYIYFNELLNH